ncbi:MAG TPA: hypothetical protein VIY27_05915, partial [Myxococcota bacterium]
MLLCWFAAWFAPGVLGGRILFAEDTAAYFFANRSGLYDVAHGGGFTWWDPLPGLGLPRLANLQSGYLSPFSIVFYLVPTARAFSFYPALVLSALALFCFGLFRARGLPVLPALFGALSWACLGNVVDHVQHPPFLETLVWLPATLLAWERTRRTGSGAWAIAAGLGVALQCIGAPQFILYNGLLIALWIGLDLWETPGGRAARLRGLATAAGIAALGIALASWQLLPALELASDSHRSLVPSTVHFADYARAAPREVLLALAAEAFWWLEAPPILAHGAPYANLPNLSLVTLGFAAFATFGARRRRIEGLAALAFLLGMLGAAGGVATALGWLIPFADRIRAPIRMIVPAGFLLSWLAACGMQRCSQAWPGARRGVAILAIGWLGLLAVTLQWRGDTYDPPDAFRVPTAIAAAEPRVAVDIRGSQGLPLFAINASLAAGVPNLLPRAALRPRNYFEAIFASQYGSLDQARKLNRMISATVLGLTDPSLPLMRAYGLRTLIRYRQGEPEAVPLRDAVPRFFIAPRVRAVPERRARWAVAADAGWDPLREVISERPVPGAALPGE